MSEFWLLGFGTIMCAWSIYCLRNVEETIPNVRDRSGLPTLSRWFFGSLAVLGAILVILSLMMLAT